MSANELWWHSISRMLGERIPGAAERRAEKERQEREDVALIEKGRALADLRKHPGWPLYLAEVQMLVRRSEEAILSVLPVPTQQSPEPYYEMAQDHALRGQIRGYRAAMGLVDEIIAQASELASRRAESGEGNQ